MNSDFFNSSQLAWFGKLARYPGRVGVDAIKRLGVDETTKNECLEHLACMWISRTDHQVVPAVDARFDWAIELMFEKPEFVEIQLKQHGPTLTEAETDEIATTLLCRVGFLSSRFLQTSTRRVREHQQLMEIVRILLRNGFNQWVK